MARTGPEVRRTATSSCVRTGSAHSNGVAGRRSAGRCEWRGTRSGREPLAAAATIRTYERTLDLRDVPPAGRHPKIFDAFGELDGGESLTLVNDHEPRPLFYEMKTEVDSVDPERYSVVQVGPEEYRAELPRE